MVKGKTESGFEYELEDDILDDYELLELLHKVDGGDSGLIVDMVDKLLGTEQKNRLKDHIRNEAGKVSAKLLLKEVSEILSSNNPGKNS